MFNIDKELETFQKLNYDGCEETMSKEKALGFYIPVSQKYFKEKAEGYITEQTSEQAMKKIKDDFFGTCYRLKKDELGGLVIILGGNNCGKTSVLDAVAKFPKQEFDEDDRTDFVTSKKIPHLDMQVADIDISTIVSPGIMIGSGRCKVRGSVPE